MNKLFSEVVGAEATARPSLNSTVSGCRQAALLLYAMNEADRAWMLSQLSKDERAVIAPLLSELVSLAPDVDRTWMAEVALNTPTAALGLQDLLASADADMVALALRNEPPSLVRLVGSLSAWPWREAVLAQLLAPEEGGYRTDTVVDGPSEVAPALAEAVMRRLVERLTGSAQMRTPVQHASTSGGVLSKLAQRLQLWRSARIGNRAP